MYYVYILVSKRNGMLYVGVTSDIKKRIWEHREGFVSGFTKKYHVYLLVHYTCTENIESAILFEKKLKKWRRKWKLELIESMNPNWNDLYEAI